ncbi:MAG TPA: hypothetical protein VFS09_06365 [Candidatus Eisenbacteria bacterium]|nr:hypothetical protein [Candidatus Eisenbacteria bacterium]
MKSIRARLSPLLAPVKRVGRFFIKSHILTVWVGLCVFGFIVGTQARPEPKAIPFDDLYEDLRVLSYREAPSDTAARFVVELRARGRAFRQYDVDARQFLPPAKGREYWRAVSGTSYEPLSVRGRVDRGVWLEIPDSSAQSLVPEQFDELFSSTIDLVNPVAVITSAVGILSGYSVGYRLATWGQSLSSPAVQARLLATPGFGRTIAREAWRRVALEPAITLAENNAERFASVNGRQRLYSNFFKVALNDSNGFIPYEAARLESLGAVRQARAMTAFTAAVRRAAQDTCDLSSADFAAIEEWASLLDRRGHWATGFFPPPGEERIRYLGVLSWYGLAPGAEDLRRVWVGPRLLVKRGQAEGFVAEDVPRLAAACPISWRPWLGGEGIAAGPNSWTARMAGEARQFAPIVALVKRVARASAGVTTAHRGSGSPGNSGSAVARVETVGSPAAVSASGAGVPASDSVASLSTDALVASLRMSLPDSTLHVASPRLALRPDARPHATRPESTVLRAQFGGIPR